MDLCRGRSRKTTLTCFSQTTSTRHIREFASPSDFANVAHICSNYKRRPFQFGPVLNIFSRQVDLAIEATRPEDSKLQKENAPLSRENAPLSRDSLPLWRCSKPLDMLIFFGYTSENVYLANVFPFSDVRLCLFVRNRFKGRGHRNAVIFYWNSIH